MRTDIDEIDVEFNFKAKETFHLFYTKFNAAAKELDRKTNQNIFEQTVAKYRFALQIELERIAIGMIENSGQIQDMNVLKRNLTTTINDYLREFMIKSQGV